MKLRDIVRYGWRQSIKRSVFAVNDMRTRLRNLRRAGFSPAGAIDGGAYHGEWALELRRIWPNCPVLLIEPQPSCYQVLRSIVRSCGPEEVIGVALSNEVGSVPFQLDGTNSSITDDLVGMDCIEVKKTTISNILEARREFSANLLKLDLQGHEIKALEGAGRFLVNFEVIILEISVLRIGDVPIFHEVDNYMALNAFRLYDLIPMYYRPLDGALWQLDAFYVRCDSKLFASREWK